MSDPTTALAVMILTIAIAFPAALAGAIAGDRLYRKHTFKWLTPHPDYPDTLHSRLHNAYKEQPHD